MRAQAQAKVSSDIVDVDSELVRSTCSMQTCTRGVINQHAEWHNAHQHATNWRWGSTHLSVVCLRALNAGGAVQCFNVALSMPLAADDAATLAW